MISDNCRIDEFVETVKGKSPWEVIPLAVEEATWADRKFMRHHRNGAGESDFGQEYSRSLKQLINYMRYTIKPKRANDKVYQLYTAYWDNT
jgi:hypothetical protein